MINARFAELGSRGENHTVLRSSHGVLATPARENNRSSRGVSQTWEARNGVCPFWRT